MKTIIKEYHGIIVDKDNDMVTVKYNSNYHYQFEDKSFNIGNVVVVTTTTYYDHTSYKVESLRAYNKRCLE